MQTRNAHDAPRSRIAGQIVAATRFPRFLTVSVLREHLLQPRIFVEAICALQFEELLEGVFVPNPKML